LTPPIFLLYRWQTIDESLNNPRTTIDEVSQFPGAEPAIVKPLENDGSVGVQAPVFACNRRRP
jgi:hypothetical protein